MKTSLGLPGPALLFVALAVAPALRAEPPAPAGTFAGATPLEWSVRLADAEISRRGDRIVYRDGGTAKWDYSVGLFTLSLLRLGEVVPRPDYAAYAGKVIGSFLDASGQIQGYRRDEYNLDALNAGRTALALYAATHDEKYRKAAALLREQLDTQPRTGDGGFWHKQRYPHQMWLDGLYMGEPFYAEWTRTFGPPAAFDDIARQFRVVTAHTYSDRAGLLYHGWDESREQAWADKATGVSPNFWSRAIGWYAMALVDTLDAFPADHPARPELLADLRQVCAGLSRYQDPATGLWYQVTDQGARPGNYLEATASSMFVYTIAKAVNRGYLPAAELSKAVAGYRGLTEKLIRVNDQGQPSLTQCCSVAGLGYGRDGSFDYYVHEPVIDNDLKGVGPFILAGLELQRALGLPLTVAAAPAAAAGPPAPPAPPAAPEWARVPEILARIQAPVFPDRQFPITDFGAVADGTTDCTAAIAKAIAACHAAGGGHVVVPAAGVFLTGPIHLLSNVDLHLADAATLRFSTDPQRYLPVVRTRWEGTECLNYSALIYAYDQENIAITGEGTLDGSASADNWWGWTKRGKGGDRTGRNRLSELGEAGVPVEQRVFGEGGFLRPNFIQPYKCRNILIEGVHLRRSPMWEINPVLCTNVTVRKVDIVSDGPNNDGCDPDSCRDVLIEDCLFSTGDDCIAIKSGRNNDGRRVGVPSENLIIRRCSMKDGHGGVVIGSEISGDCRNVFVEDCVMDSPSLDRALRFKSNARRGGVIENVFVHNVQIGRVTEAVLTVDFLYEEGAKGPFQPVVRNVVVDHVTSRSSPRVMWIKGFPASTIDGIRFSDCTFLGVHAAEVLQGADTITFTHVTIKPATETPSLNTRPTTP